MAQRVKKQETGQSGAAGNNTDEVHQLKTRVESLEKSLFVAKVTGGAIAAAAIVFGVTSLYNLPEKVFSSAKSKVEKRIDDYISGPDIETKVDSLLDARLLQQIVQLGSVTSDTGGKNPGTEWKPWRQNVGEDTVYVGLMRRVEFDREFKSAPQVDAGLKLVNLASGSVLRQRIGFETKDERILERIQDLHAVARVEWVDGNAGPDGSGFTIKVGIGLPKAVGDKLIESLNAKTPLPYLVQHYRGLRGQVASAPLTEDEKYFINWHSEVGTLDAFWIAKGVPK